MSRRAFTLIELLVVIAIILVLVAILFPVFNGARRSAKMTTSMSNLRQMAQALAIKRTTSGGFGDLDNLSLSGDGSPLPPSFLECQPGAPANNGIHAMWEIGTGTETWREYTDRVGDSAIAIVDMCWDEVDEGDPDSANRAHLGIGAYLDTHVKKRQKTGEWREFAWWD